MSLCASLSEVVCWEEHIGLRQRGRFNRRNLQRKQWEIHTVWNQWFTVVIFISRKSLLPTTSFKHLSNQSVKMGESVFNHLQQIHFDTVSLIFQVDAFSCHFSALLFIFTVGKVKRGAFAAGRKITRIISFTKKKPPQSGVPRTACNNPRQGTVSPHFGVCHQASGSSDL